MSDGLSALLLIQAATDLKKKGAGWPELPSGSWIWSGDPEDAARVALTVITHPDLSGFFASGGVLLQVGHRVVTDYKEWANIRDDVLAVWRTIDGGVRTGSKANKPKAKVDIETRELLIPKAHGDIGYQYREFKWRRPASAERPVFTRLQSAVAIAANAEPGDRAPVRRRPAPHVIELHTAAHPVGVRLKDEADILKRVDQLLRTMSEAAEAARQADPFGSLDDRLQAAMLLLYRQLAFSRTAAHSAKLIVSILSSERANRDMRELSSRVNDLIKLIGPHRPKWIDSVRGKDGGYFLRPAGRRLVSAAIDRLELDPNAARWPGTTPIAPKN